MNKLKRVEWRGWGGGEGGFTKPRVFTSIIKVPYTPPGHPALGLLRVTTPLAMSGGAGILYIMTDTVLIVYPVPQNRLK